MCVCVTAINEKGYESEREKGGRERYIGTVETTGGRKGKGK